MALNDMNPVNSQQAAQMAGRKAPVQAAAPAPASGLVAGSMPGQSPLSYTAQTSTVNQPTETVQGQVNSILATDSPLMERARTLATQQMAGRGLVNSSMTAGAGVAAMTDRAMEMGGRDAEIYGNRNILNTNSVNQAGQFNAGQANENDRQSRAISAQSAEAAAARTFQAEQQTKQNAFASDQQGRQNTFAGEQQATQQQFSATQAGLDREQQVAMAKLQESLNGAQVSKTFAANTTTGTLNAINAVQMNPELSPEAKRGAIGNIIAVGNSTLQWGSKFYNTQLPDMQLPSGPTAAPAPGIAPLVGGDFRREL